MKRLNSFCRSPLPIFLALQAILIASCGNLTSPTATPATPNLTKISNGLAAPAVGQSSRWSLDPSGIPTRTDSRMGCESVAASARLSNAIQQGRLLACVFGVMEGHNLVAQAATGYNYYTFTRNSTVYNLRYGTLAGNLHLNACSGTTELVELDLAKTSSGGTITLVAPFTGGAASLLFQGSVTLDTSLAFVSATGKTSGTNTGAFSLTKGSPNVFSHYWQTPARTVKLYSLFNSTEGASQLTVTGTGALTASESWTNVTASACQSPKTSGAFYAAASTYDMTSIVAPSTAPAYMDDWTTCAPPSGTVATAIVIEEPTTLAAIQTCVTNYGTEVTEPLACATVSVCP